MKNLVLFHVIRMTKLFTYAFLIQCLSMSFLFGHNGNAQIKDIEDVMIRVSLDNIQVEDAFSIIEDLSGFSFVFSAKEMKNVARVSSNNQTQSLYDL
ncbi:MAG: hypothetical protein WDZ72_01375, partial [Cyclobacteriaceae bacterium]